MDIQMNRKELTEIVMMISNLNKPFGFQDFNKINLALQGSNGKQKQKRKRDSS